MVHLPHYQAPPRTAQEKPPNKEDAKPKRAAKPARPKLATKMNKSTAAIRLRTIRDQNVIAHRGHQDRLALAESVMRADARRNHELEYNKLLGASAFGGLSAYSLARLEDLKKVI